MQSEGAWSQKFSDIMKAPPKADEIPAPKVEEIPSKAPKKPAKPPVTEKKAPRVQDTKKIVPKDVPKPKEKKVCIYFLRTCYYSIINPIVFSRKSAYFTDRFCTIYIIPLRELLMMQKANM